MQRQEQKGKDRKGKGKRKGKAKAMNISQLFDEFISQLYDKHENEDNLN